MGKGFPYSNGPDFLYIYHVQPKGPSGIGNSGQGNEPVNGTGNYWQPQVILVVSKEACPSRRNGGDGACVAFGPVFNFHFMWINYRF
jgi:hypothetical protein